MSNFRNYARLDVVAFVAWLASQGLSRQKLEAKHDIPRRYWQRWQNGTRIAPAVQRRLVEEVGVPATVFVLQAQALTSAERAEAEVTHARR